ncbi:hypothetical protein ACI6Q2_01340 [Chitinophagaceae bacterium LWZ2-11]
MKKAIVSLLILSAVACSSKKKIPDVSNIKVELQTIRFEKDFFAVDTNKIDASLQSLNNKFPGFTQDFLFNILGTAPNNDSAAKDIKMFMRTYKSMYDSSQIIFANFNKIEKEVKTGLQRVKYYFPDYKEPKQLITFVGPINSYGNIITPDALGVGLQLYLGQNYSIYNSDEGKEMYPFYMSRRFTPDYIPVNCMKNIIDDMFPYKNAGRPLIEQMIEAGKRLYVLDAFMPETADSIKTGYTQAQLTGCYDHEKDIWAFFLQNDLLYNADISRIGSYINDGPNTTEFGPSSPGNIGQFIGWQIVKKWMDKNEKVTLAGLVKTPASKILDEAKYKPR